MSGASLGYYNPSLAMPDRKRVLYMFGGLRGGAALSFAQYAQAASRMGYEVLACAPDSPGSKPQGLRDVAITQCPPCRMHRPDEVWRALAWYRRYCAAHSEIALIHVNWVGHYPLAKALGQSIGAPVVYTYVDTTIWDRRFLEGLERGQNFTTYCREFKERLTGVGVDPDSISECACRFDFSRLPQQSSETSCGHMEAVSCAVVGRLDSEKLDSVRTVLKIVEGMLARGVKTEVHFYGDGTGTDEVKCLCSELSNEDSSPVAVFHGYVKDADLLMGRHDLVFGKGRCIVEALAQGIRAVVIGENRKWRLVREGNWRQLAEANFSGRGLGQPSTFDELEDWLRDSEENENESKELCRSIRASFDARNLDSWLAPVYEKALSMNVSHQPFRASLGLLALSFRSSASFVLKEKLVRSS